MPGRAISLGAEILYNCVYNNMKVLSCSIWDTGLDADIRKSTFPGANAIMICFPVNQSGDEMLKTLRHFAEEARDCPNVFLVGTKTELRRGSEENVISPKRGVKLVKELNAAGYLESLEFPY